MNWFDKWLINKASGIMSKQEEKMAIAIDKKHSKSFNLIAGGGSGLARTPERRSELESHPDLNFRMYRAENGYVMEVRQYDRRTDNQNINMHLIPDGQDLGQSIAHIITVESLKVQ